MAAEHLKPQDVVVALKLARGDGEEWTQRQLAGQLCLSVSELNHALRRLEASRLYVPTLKRVVRPRLYEFLVHGLAYVFPTKPGAPSWGLPTGLSAPPLARTFLRGAEDEMVWPYPKGTTEGRSIEPLYKSVPQAAAADPVLHESLAVLDVLRLGRARERQAAVHEIERWLRA